MGIVHEEITLRNAIDVGNCQRGLIEEQEVRQLTIQVVVDTGAATLVINDDIRRKLGLELRGTKQVRMANNAKETVTVAEPVEIRWKNRETACQPWVLSDSKAILLGAIPLEDMDLIVDPTKQVLTGAHGDEAVGILMYAH